MARIGKKLRSLEGGQALFFCPGCRKGHAVRIVPDGGKPCWSYNGNPNAPTFRASIFVNPPGAYHVPSVPPCHSFVTDGQIQFLTDCTHALAGQTVPLPDIDIIEA